MQRASMTGVSTAGADGLSMHSGDASSHLAMYDKMFGWFSKALPKTISVKGSARRAVLPSNGT